MSTQHEAVVNGDDFDMSALDDLLADLAGDEIVEDDDILGEEEVIAAAVEEDIAKVVENIAAEEELIAEYEQQVSPEMLESAAKPTPPVEKTDESSAAKVSKRVAKAGKTAGERIATTLPTAKLAEFAVLDTTDVHTSEEAAVEALQATVGTMAKYVSDKAVNLFAFLNGNSPLTEVTRRAVKVLERDGNFTGGAEGNLYGNLLTKPYSPGTAASQSNQIFQLFTDLKIVKRDGRSAMSLNPNSALWPRIKDKMDDK